MNRRDFLATFTGAVAVLFAPELRSEESEIFGLLRRSKGLFCGAELCDHFRRNPERLGETRVILNHLPYRFDRCDENGHPILIDPVSVTDVPGGKTYRHNPAWRRAKQEVALLYYHDGDQRMMRWFTYCRGVADPFQGHG